MLKYSFCRNLVIGWHTRISEEVARCLVIMVLEGCSGLSIRDEAVRGKQPGMVCTEQGTVQ
jgi:hypothetical protein